MITPEVPDSLLDSLEKAAERLAQSPYRSGSELVLSEGELMVTGDLHGDVSSFERIAKTADLDKCRQRHLLLQELIHGRDDRSGSDGSCVLVEKAAALVNAFPDRVHVIMGNHEMAQLSGRVIIKDGVVLNEAFSRSARARYGESSGAVVAAMERFWRALPLAVRTGNRLFVSHSLPSRKLFGAFDAGVLKRPLADADFARDSGAAYALLWGRDFSSDVAGELSRILDVDFFITGHVPCDNGFHAPNGRHVILDSQGPNGRYALVPLAEALTYEGIVGRIRPVWA